MSVFRIHHTNEYTVISNKLIRDKNLDLKTLGLFVKMLSLPCNWDFSIKGLTVICKDGKTAIMTALNELEEFGYLKRSRTYKDGKLDKILYDLYEIPELQNDNNNVTPETVFELDLGEEEQANEVEVKTETTKKEKSNKSSKISFNDPSVSSMTDDEFFNTFKNSKDLKVLFSWSNKKFRTNKELKDLLIKWINCQTNKHKYMSLDTYNDKLDSLVSIANQYNVNINEVVRQTTEKGYYSFEYVAKDLAKVNRSYSNQSYQYKNNNNFNTQQNNFGVDRQLDINNNEVF